MITSCVKGQKSRSVIRPTRPLLLTALHHDDCAHMITLEMFTKGFYVLDFDLTPNRQADEEHISLPRQGNVRIVTRFKKPLPEPVT